MSDLATSARLRQATSQLPAAWYCDPRVFEAERRQLFSRAPGYAGHELMVPAPGDYHVLAARDNAQTLVHGPQGVELLSNICRHRQAISADWPRLRGNSAASLAAFCHWEAVPTATSRSQRCVHERWSKR